MSHIEELTPQMADYNERFYEDGNVRWMPYLMYFNPRNLRLESVNTDKKGFRYSERDGQRFSPIDLNGATRVRLLVGSSTTFGLGATSDTWTLQSRLNQHDPLDAVWLNFGGVSFTSTQELMLFVLYQNLLPKVDEIVIFSGFNTLGLSRQPEKYRGDHGAIYSCKQFYDSMYSAKKERRFWPRLFSKNSGKTFTSETPSVDENVPTFDETPPVSEQIDFASNLIAQQLQVWRTLADKMDAKLTYILQPLATWVRQKGSPEEELIFAELERHWKFTESFGDILTLDVHQSYASKLEDGSKAAGVQFVDMNPILIETLSPDQWTYVDRVHFTDQGHDLVAKKVLEAIR